jgi:hypothetical protein
MVDDRHRDELMRTKRNDLATVNPELAAQLVDAALAQTLTRSSNQSVHWFCDGTTDRPHPRHEWTAKVRDRQAGNGCPACSRRVPVPGWNDLATVNPELAAQLVDPALAQALTRSSGKSVQVMPDALPSPGAALPPPPGPTPNRDGRDDWVADRVAIVASGAGLVIGAFLPWASVSFGFGTVSKNGIEGDGVITAAAGLLIIVLCLMNSRRSYTVAIGVAVLSLLVSAYDWIDVSSTESIQVGIGLYVTAGAGLVAMFSAHNQRRRST